MFVRVENVNGQLLVPPEVHHHLSRLCHIQLQVVLPKPLHKIADQVPVLPPTLYMAHNGCVIREFLQMTQLTVVLCRW